MANIIVADVNSEDEDDDIGGLKYQSSRYLAQSMSHQTRKDIDKYIADVSEATPGHVSSSIMTEDLSTYGDSDRLLKRQKQERLESERVDWSDNDSENEGAAAYKKFHSRHSEARKRAAKSAKRTRAIKTGNYLREKAGDTTGVGRRESKKAGRQKKKEHGPDISDDDDSLMEWTVPDYLQKRRALFDSRMERLKQGGLKLPPSYDDVEFSDDERLASLEEKPDFPRTKSSAPYRDIPLPYSLGIIPAPIAQWLREYQVKGVEFLHELFVYQRGGILGDDMGLGKTVQVIAFLTAAFGKTGDERDGKRMRKMRRQNNLEIWYPRVLILCPGSLMSNWQEEFNRWGWWSTDIYHGSTKEDALRAAQSGRLEVIITTYTTYRNNRSDINLIAWDCVVADECHQFKERNSELAKAMNELNALCRIGLTGTAIQNKYEELWTLLNWTNPGVVGPISTWKASICEPLKLGQSHDATVYQLSRARKTATSLVQNLLPRFFLRRMKTLIKDQLPKKTDRVVFCPLTATQSRAYETFLRSEIVQCIKGSSEMCECNSGKKAGWCHHMFLEDGSAWQQWVFPAIVTLQKLSNHLAILIPQGNDPADKQAKDLDTLQIVMPDQWQELYKTRDSVINYATPEFCGKWRILKKLLKFWHDEGGNKILVFSHSVRLLKMLHMLFSSTSYNVSYLDGSMKYEDRYAVVGDFNTNPAQFVFLISTKAGGVGLNITSANKVVVVDPNWNPSYDLQAQDRAYRIGQTRDVEVFRLVSQGTLEEIVYARQIYKQQQANIGYNASTERRYFQGVQDRTDKKGEIFGLKNLFAYQHENVVLRDIVNKTNVAESRADLQIVDLQLEAEDIDEEGEEEDSKTPADENVIPDSVKAEPDNEDAAISQLANLIIGGSSKTRKKTTSAVPNNPSRSKKHDPIQAILSSVGVEYTHENSEVIGGSKVEARLSKRAEAAADDTRWGTEEQQAKVFVEEKDGNLDPVSESLSVYRSGEFANSSCSTDGIRYRYRPPEEVKRRQFCTMAKWAGYDDTVEFALWVETRTQSERRDMLSEFYSYRSAILATDDRVKEESQKLMGFVKSEEREKVIQSDSEALLVVKLKDEEEDDKKMITSDPADDDDEL